MRMFCYYAAHAVKNQIKKLFRTWVAVFILICVVFGAAVGIGAAILSDSFDDTVVSDGELPADEDVPDEPPSPETVATAVELAAAVLTLSGLIWNVLSANRSGGQIFQMADVNLLFPSPRKPQSVLLFRLLNQLGMLLLVSLYMLFQLPNLVGNVGISAAGALLLILDWFFLLAYTKLINVGLYTVCSTHEQWKGRIRPVTYTAVGALLAGFLLFWRSGNHTWLDAAITFFNAPATRFIPIYGWIKGLSVTAVTGQWLTAGLYALLLAGGLVLLVWGIWHIRADFYEDAMERSAELDEARRAAAASRTGTARTRKKARSDRLRRGTFRHGSGANVYFYKAMYNRFRFAHGRVFTPTSEFYLFVSAGVCALLYFGAETLSLTPVALVLAGCCFFRALRNPIAADTEQPSFRLVPESAHAKVFFALMGGSLNCAMDLLPAFLVATVWMRGDPFAAVAWLLFAVTLDFYSSNVGLFLDLSIPTNLAKTVKQLIQIAFVYFGLAPTAVLVVIGFVLHAVPLFVGLAAALALGIGFAFFGISPLFLQNGQK